MRKLKLVMDALEVESFETAREQAEAGTVHGHALSDSTCAQRVCTCANETEWDVTCGTCNELDCGGDETRFFCPTSPGYQGC